MAERTVPSGAGPRPFALGGVHCRAVLFPAPDQQPHCKPSQSTQEKEARIIASWPLSHVRQHAV